MSSWRSSNTPSSGVEAGRGVDQNANVLQAEAPSAAAAKQAAALCTTATATQQQGNTLTEQHKGSMFASAEVEQMKQLLLAAAAPASSSAAASCTPAQEQAALLQLAQLLLRLHSKATAAKQQQAKPAAAPAAGSKRPALEEPNAPSSAPAEVSFKATKVDQQQGPHSNAIQKQQPAGPAHAGSSATAAAAAAATLHRVTQEQQYELLLRASSAVGAAAAAAAAGLAGGSSNNSLVSGVRPILPVRQLPLGMRVSHMQSAGLLVPLDALAAVRQHQQQQQQQALLQMRQQYQQQQLQQLQQQGWILYGGEDTSAAAAPGTDSAPTGKTSKGSKSHKRKANKDGPAWHPKHLHAAPASTNPAKPAPPRLAAAYTGENGAMAGWPDRAYMPGSDRDRVWQEHKLVMRVAEAVLQSQPQAGAAVQEANSIFAGRSCTSCWQMKPINGQWCCTKPFCYKAAAAASSATPEDELLLENWEKVQQVHRRLRQQTVVSAAAAAGATEGEVATRSSAAEEEAAAGGDAAPTEAEEAAAALAALAGSDDGGSSPSSNNAELTASRAPVTGSWQQDTDRTGHGREVQQRQASFGSATPACSSPGAAACLGDAAGNLAAAGSSRTADAAAAAAALSRPLAPADPTTAAAAVAEASLSGLTAAAAAAVAAAPSFRPGAGPIVDWVPPINKYSNSNVDMQRLWREHQLNLKVLAVVLQHQPEALLLLQRIVDL
jgi:hypothetical protein